ncbi:MAG: redoxin domain-containing protein [Bacteroidales bacterium]|nr:redoxin domain-containing protein [Bacteroidales bacterium]
MKTRQAAKRLTVIGLSAIFLISCFPQEQTGHLAVYPGKFAVGPTAWNGTITVNSSDSWYLEPIGNADWCTIYPDKNTPGQVLLDVNVDPMPDILPRTAIFSVKASSGLERFITIEQKDSEGTGFYLDFFGNPESTHYVYPSDVEPLKFLINTNASQWSIFVSPQAEDWLIAERKKDTLVISVKDIDGPTGRKGTVTASAGGSVAKTLSVSQMGLHEYGAPTKNFSLPIPGVPNSDLTFRYVHSRARITMLLLWGTWCPDCTNYLPMVKELYEEFKDHGFKIYGVAMENIENQQAYFDYMESNGMDDVDEETGKKLWWENRPVYFPREELKVNSFSAMFYGNKLFTGEVKNFVPAFFFVDGGGRIIRPYVDNYVLRTDAAIKSLYRNMRTFLSRQLECCGN